MNILKQRISLDVYNKLLEAEIDSISKILLQDQCTLCNLTKLSNKDVKHILQEVVDITLKTKFVPALEIPVWQRLTTGCTVIDSVTRGGIPVNGITEIVGQSGVGKTQLCLQLALTVQFPVHLGGLNKGAVYICTEDIFPSKRLHQLSKAFPHRFSNLEHIKFEDNIFLEHISDFEQLRICLFIRLPRLLFLHNIGLIVIDSIAGVFRSETIGVNYTSRSREFLTIASQLNKFGCDNEIAIVVTNQVADNMETGKAEPCLGLAWSNLVTCRFSISRYLENKRSFDVIFAPDLPTANCKFVVRDFGLTSLE